MRRALLRGLAVSALAVSVVQAGGIETEIAYLDALRRVAMVDADSAALDSLLADGCVYTHSTGLVQTKDDLIAMLAGGGVDYASFDVTDPALYVYEGAAVITGTQTIELVVRGDPVTSVSRYTAVWVRDRGAWRCAAYQSTPIPSEKGRE